MRAIQRKTKREEGRYKGTQPEVKLSRCHSSMSLVTSYTFNLLETAVDNIQSRSYSTLNQ